MNGLSRRVDGFLYKYSFGVQFNRIYKPAQLPGHVRYSSVVFWTVLALWYSTGKANVSPPGWPLYGRSPNTAGFF